MKLQYWIGQIDKFDLQIPETTDEVIFPVPIKPSFINVFSTLNY